MNGSTPPSGPPPAPPRRPADPGLRGVIAWATLLVTAVVVASVVLFSMWTDRLLDAVPLVILVGACWTCTLLGVWLGRSDSRPKDPS